MLSTEYKPTTDEIYQNAAESEDHCSQCSSIQLPQTCLRIRRIGSGTVVRRTLQTQETRIATQAIRTTDQRHTSAGESGLGRRQVALS